MKALVGGDGVDIMDDFKLFTPECCVCKPTIGLFLSYSIPGGPSELPGGTWLYAPPGTIGDLFMAGLGLEFGRLLGELCKPATTEAKLGLVWFRFCNSIGPVRSSLAFIAASCSRCNVSSFTLFNCFSLSARSS